MPIAFVVIGLVVGLVSLALVSNQFGNTDIFGLVLLGCSGWVFVTGICLFFIPLRYASVVGLFTAPLLFVLLFVLYWVALISNAFLNSDHQDFEVNGVTQIQPSKEMDELYENCRHFITYGQNSVPLFNSVAYFGDRYELTMQVPVQIFSARSGTTIAEPKFYLNEVSKVSLSPSGEVSAAFSRNMEFGALEWKRVYESDGDYSSIGFTVNSTGVPNFKEFSSHR